MLRVAASIQRELAPVIREMRDPCARDVVVTDVEVSPDLSVATVYIHTSAQPGNEPDKDECCRRLTRASGFLLKQLAARLRLRALPKLVFLPNDSLERGARMEALLAGVADE